MELSWAGWFHTAMRFVVTLLFLLNLTVGLRAAARAATADELALFQAALKNSTQETERWAYTETRVTKGSKGINAGTTVVRFDPSKPYAEQFTPLTIDGQPPSEKDLKKYRERGEKRGKQVAQAAEAAATTTAPPPATLGLGGRKIPINIEHPLVAAETAEQVVFEVPLMESVRDVPPDKIQILARVNRASRLIETVDFRVKESFRMKLVAKIKAGSVKMDFAVVDPKFAPVITTVAGDFAASVVFIPFNGTYAQTRTDWKRVKPYSERFQVKLGPMEFLDF